MPKEQIVWKKKAEAEDYAGARSFLSLIFSDAKAKKLLAALHKAKNIEYAAKDLLRASNLPLLPRDEPHVDEDLKRIHKSKPLAPLLLIRGDMSKGVPLIVADGYHRICAICYFDESAPIPCRMVSADNSVAR
jgi:CRISPR/Cas system-associated protein Cas10 (large subunit of type III CRISPR-Cas system)